MHKSNFFKPLVAASLLMLSAMTAFAQVNHSFYLMGTAPTGESNSSIYIKDPSGLTMSPMGREDIGKGSAVGLGFNYRASYTFDIGYGEVMPFADVEFFWNRIKGSYRDEYDKARCTDPHYFNVPIMIGLQYSYDITTLLKPYAELGIGYDLFFATAEGWKSDAAKPYFAYKIKGALAWQFGVGTYLGPHVSVGLTYYGLGKHMIDYKTSKCHYADACEFINQNKTESRNVGLFALKVGFHL